MESLLYFHHVGSRDQTQFINLRYKYLYPLTHLASPDITSNCIFMFLNLIYKSFCVPSSGVFPKHTWYKITSFSLKGPLIPTILIINTLYNTILSLVWVVSWVAQAGLKLITQLTMVLNSWSSCLHFLSARIADLWTTPNLSQCSILAPVLWSRMIWL